MAIKRGGGRRGTRMRAKARDDEPSGPIAVIDVGSTAIRLVVGEAPDGGEIRVLEEASRGVLLGKDTFTTGRISAATLEASLRAMEGFRHIMDTYGVTRCRAVATNAIREASNCETVLDRIRLRTGIEVEVIDGAEENRLTYMAVRKTLGDHEALKHGNTLIVEVGGGNADISFLRDGEPVVSGNYPLGALRMRQIHASWHGSHEQRVRLLTRHIKNVVHDILLQIPLNEAKHFIALGGDMRFAAARILGGEDTGEGVRVVKVKPFEAFVDEISNYNIDQIAEDYHLPPAEAETLVPALLAYRALISETSVATILVPDVSLRAGLLLDATRKGDRWGIEDFRRQVLSSAAALGQKYHYDEAHARAVAQLSVTLFDQLRNEHGLSDRDRLLLEVAALLHDVGMFLSLRAHHKHSQYILTVSEIFGMSRDDMAIIAGVARYHRRAMPQKSHLPYMGLDRESRVKVNKLAAILRLANSLDADHLQKMSEVKILREEDAWVLEVKGAGDLTIERLAALARSDLFTEVFGQRLKFREAGAQA